MTIADYISREMSGKWEKQWGLYKIGLYILLGAVLGRTAYRDKKTLLPKVPAEAAPLRFFRWCGTHSLWIYLLHQPVIYGVIEVILLLKK